MSIKWLFQDLDGCLADFEKKVLEITGYHVSDFGKNKPGGNIGKMWGKIAWYRNPKSERGFFADLEFMPDGKELWEHVKQYEPIILTGCPHGNWAPGQKRLWVGEQLGWDVPIITCFSKEKHIRAMEHINQEDLQGAVLVDDTLRLEKAWLDNGGTFVHHTSAEKTIEQLLSL